MTRSPSRRLLVAGIVVLAVALTTLIARTPEDLTAPPSVTPVTVETLDEQIARVAALVADLRGLTFAEVPRPDYLSPDELAAAVAELASEYSPEDADVDTRVLVALGAVPDGTDLHGLLTSALTEQVAGYYDPTDQRLVVGVRSQNQRLGPLDELTLAHELQHALADQVLGLPDLEVQPGEEDAAFALQALIEGDATLVMEDYALVGLSLIDQIRLAGESFALADEIAGFTQLPHYLQRSLLLPYEEGLEFVRHLVTTSGWGAVDAAYADPPTTTAEILFPDRYLAGFEAVAPRPPGDPGAPWSHRATLALGAADLLLLFEAPGGDPHRALDFPRERAGDWRGGAIDLYVDGAASAVGVALVGAEGLCLSVTAWYRAAVPSATASATGDGTVRFDDAGRDAVVRCTDGEVRIGIAPDLATAASLAG